MSRPSPRDLAWKGEHLMIGRKRSGIRIVPAAKYPGIMWRVEYPMEPCPTWSIGHGPRMQLSD
jgi:hypothetical protein